MPRAPARRERECQGVLEGFIGGNIGRIVGMHFLRVCQDKRNISSASEEWWSHFDVPTCWFATDSLVSTLRVELCDPEKFQSCPTTCMTRSCDVRFDFFMGSGAPLRNVEPVKKNASGARRCVPEIHTQVATHFTTKKKNGQHQ